MAIHLSEKLGRKLLCSLLIPGEITAPQQNAALAQVKVWARSTDLIVHEYDGPLGRGIRFIWTDNEPEMLKSSVQDENLNLQMEALLNSLRAKEAYLSCGNTTFTFKLE